MSKDLDSIMKVCRRHKIFNLELGSGFVYDRSLLNTVQNASTEFNFLVHNYFPPPRRPFVLNLGSLDDGILALSMGHCRKAIDLAQQLDAPFYSAHSAFCFNAPPDFFKRNRRSLQLFSKEKSYSKFLEAVKRLSAYAGSKRIDFLIENNSMPRSELRNDKNVLALMVEAEEMIRIVKDVDSSNFRVLMDMGHVKIAAHALCFDAYLFVEKVAPYTAALHLSDNDGEHDLHRSFSSRAWFLPFLKYFKDRHIIIECDNLPVADMLRCRDVVYGALH